MKPYSVNRVLNGMSALPKRIQFLPLALRILAILDFAMAYSEETEGEAANILIFGDSLTAGFGVDFEQAYPNRVQELIDRDGLAGNVIPSGVSGETSAGGLRRVSWAMRVPIDIFVLALGGNDGLRGIDLEDTRHNLLEIANKVRAQNPSVRIAIAGMQMPPNLGAHYTEAFAALYPSVAAELDAYLIPFLLEGVGGDPKLNLSDGIHPNPEGHKRIARYVYGHLKTLLGED